MTNLKIFDAALRIVCESEANGDVEDYKERSPYLLALVCTECAELDKAYRTANNLSSGSKINNLYLNLESTFPLSDTFAPAVSYYLAAMLVLDENEDMSDKLFARYTDAISSIQATLPVSSAPIGNHYPNLL